MPGTLAASYRHCIFYLCCLFPVSILPSVCLRPFPTPHCACAEPRQHKSRARSGSLRTRELLPRHPPCSMWVQVLRSQPLGRLQTLHLASCQNVASHSWSLREIECKVGPTARIWPLAPCCSAALPLGGHRAPPPLLESF